MMIGWKGICMDNYFVNTGLVQLRFSTIDDAINALWIALTCTINDFIDYSILEHAREVVESGNEWTDKKLNISVYKNLKNF